jgi:hypothetical protein
MGLFTNPLGYAGYPPRANAPADVVNSTVRAATTAEATAGVLDYVYISPATASAIGAGADFASPGPIGSTTPNSGIFTTLASTGSSAIASGTGVAARLGNSTGTLGFFGSTGATQVTQAALTNSVTAGGTTGTIANYTDLSIYANDSAAIRNDIYQLSLALTNVVGALRSYGLLV